MKPEETTLPEGVTKQQIEDWKKKHVRIKQVVAKRKTGGSVSFIVGQPTREIMDSWLFHFDKGSYPEARAVLTSNCVLHGDVSLLEEDINLQSTILKKIQGMLEDFQTSEKEL